jgi:hypothetical protein
MIYTVLDKNTEKENDVQMSYEEFKDYLKNNPNIQQIFKCMNYAYRIGKLPVSDAWRSKLKAMQKANPGNTIQIP